jgi:hypothetical protein
VTDQQDDIEDDVDAPKCKACGVPWTRHQGIIAICQQYLETVETLERVTIERDEARRLACGALASGGWDVFAEPDDWGANLGRDLLMRDQADERKWDCFKSDHIGEPNEMDAQP